jgi:hypothetical protein
MARFCDAIFFHFDIFQMCDNLLVAFPILSANIVTVFNRDGCGQLRVLSIKSSLVTLCAGKFVDKLKCEFRLLSH